MMSAAVCRRLRFSDLVRKELRESDLGREVLTCTGRRRSLCSTAVPVANTLVCFEIVDIGDF